MFHSLFIDGLLTGRIQGNLYIFIPVIIAIKFKNSLIHNTTNVTITKWPHVRKPLTCESVSQKKFKNNIYFFKKY